MAVKLYAVTISFESEEEGYLPNQNRVNVLAKTAEEAIEKVTLDRNEFVDGVEFVGVVDLE